MYGAFEDGNTYQENNKLDIITSTTLDFEPIKNVLKFTGDFTYKAIRSTQQESLASRVVIVPQVLWRLTIAPLISQTGVSTLITSPQTSSGHTLRNLVTTMI